MDGLLMRVEKPTLLELPPLPFDKHWNSMIFIGNWSLLVSLLHALVDA